MKKDIIIPQENINIFYKAYSLFLDKIVLESKNISNYIKSMIQYIYTSLRKGVFMHRLNLTIDEALYEQARAVSFIEKKSISQMIRESLSEYIAKNSKTKQQANLILEADDEKEILSILANDEFISNDDFKSKFNL